MALKEKRHQQIVQVIKENQQVTVVELSQKFHVSEVTIRRDLRELSSQGIIQRSHGGAVSTAPISEELPINRRMTEAYDIKVKLGQAAANLVSDGDAIFIGSGSTTAFVARHLTQHRNLTVITNALTVAQEFAFSPTITVVSTGGVLRPSEMSLIGHIAEQSLRELRVDKVFVGMQAIHIDAGMTNDYLPEVMTDRTILDLGSELIVLADHSKFGKVASAFIAPIDKVTTLITDRKTPAKTLEAIQRKGIELILVDERDDSD